MSGAFFALVSSFFVIYYLGKDVAGEYFLIFAISYFVAQIIRFGGEIEVLTEDSKVLSTSFSISIIIIFLVYFLSFLLAVTNLFSYSFVCLFSVGIASTELLSDGLKKKGYAACGVFTSSLFHLFMLPLLVFTEIDLKYAALYSVFINVCGLLLIVFLLKSDYVLSFSIFKNIEQKVQAAFYNLVQNVATPLFLYLFSFVASLSDVADFRVSMRLAVLIHFSYLAVQQTIIRKSNRSENFVFNVLEVNKMLLVIGSFSFLCVLFSALFLSYFYMGNKFFFFSLIWSLSFLMVTFFGGVMIRLAILRDFKSMFYSRIIAIVFVLLSYCLVLYSGFENVFIYAFVFSLFFSVQVLIVKFFYNFKYNGGRL